MTGDTLRAALATPSPPTVPLITDFLFERSIFLITGEAGKGKSVITTQIGMSLTAAPTVFDSLRIPKPRTVYYMQMEGHLDEQLDRMRFMQQAIPFEPSRFYLDGGKHTRLNAMSPASVQQKLTQIKEAMPQPPALIVIDPIYKAVADDLAKGKPALDLINFCDLAYEAFQCSIGLVHHPHREKYDVKGQRIEETDAYYGHSYLRNYVDLSYTFRQIGDGAESELVRKKYREARSLAYLRFAYHPETYTVSMLPIASERSKTEEIDRYLRHISRNGKTTTFAEVKQSIGVSDRLLRTRQQFYVNRHELELLKSPGKPTVWVPKLG